MLLDNAQSGCFIAQVHFFENVFGMFGDMLQIGQMSRVREAVEIDQPRDFRAFNDLLDYV